ncbi:MAG: hypothetical protein NWF05_11555 [Candidatus Bathyarchaeota archaeon]|nr:hypothetical protein [Candidatus Bathyarchaeota archaeon]
MATNVTYVPFIFLVSVVMFIVFIAVTSIIRSQHLKKANRYRSKTQKYVPGGFSSSMELDLRLPYRRFTQLYPGNRLTYPQYKRLQMQRAFRRSMSSQDNKRMVR